MVLTSIDLKVLTNAEIVEAFPAGVFLKSAVKTRKGIIASLSNIRYEDVERIILPLIEAKKKKIDIVHNLDFKPRDPMQYMETPTDSDRRRCHQRFIQATSNQALLHQVCGACARELPQTDIQGIPIDYVPHSEKLALWRSHPAHQLTNGMLLEKTAIYTDEGVDTVFVCDSCLQQLRKAKRPTLSLANNMWIGAIPLQLSDLTLPEQMLIALHFPRCYIYKLYPASGRGGFAESQIQNGIRGNVTSYEQNIQAIVDMTAGKLMPQKLEVLNEVIAVAFIGPGKVPKRWLISTFRIRRKMVWAALTWLKQNNPHYEGIILDESRLSLLPEDDVPDQILASISQDPNPDIATQEREGYTQADDDLTDYVATQKRGDNIESDDDIDESHQHNTLTDVQMDCDNVVACERGTSPGPEENAETSDINEDIEMKDDTDAPGSGGQPEVVSLRYLGCAEQDTSSMSSKELMMFALANLQSEKGESGYANRHGKFVSDLNRTKFNRDSEYRNYAEAAFPCLYPYGVGGLEAHRETPVSFQTHVQWSLQHYDRRFRIHHSFPFVMFGIIRKRQSLSSAQVQMRRQDFERVSRVISTLTIEDFKKAERQEEKGEKISDRRMQLLRKHIFATGGRVMGSDASRHSYRSQIWGTVAYLGSPGLWVTINPIDLHDPIAQVFAGQEINMDDFIRTAGPSSTSRAENIAEDPYAAAKFYEFIIQTIIETLFDIKVNSNGVISSGKGIFGTVTGYFGVTEAQGRGTLHLHMLIWLANAPTPDEMRDLLKSSEFRRRVCEYIESTVHSHHDALTDVESVKATPKDNEIAYSRPPNPEDPNYAEQREQLVLKVVRTSQVHTCSKNTCLRMTKNGATKCKRRAPWPLVSQTHIEENGSWATRRTYGYLNAWNPDIAIALRANHDVKVLTNGEETKNITWYSTCYQTKSQDKSHNLSALIAKKMVYHFDDEPMQNRAQERTRLLLFRALNAVNSGAEFSGSQVISLLELAT